jgi:hypothetical protein
MRRFGPVFVINGDEIEGFLFLNRFWRWYDVSLDVSPSALTLSGDDELEDGDDAGDDVDESITLELERENPWPLSLWCRIALDEGAGTAASDGRIGRGSSGVVGGGGGGGDDEAMICIFPLDIVCGNDSEWINPCGDERNVAS